MQSILREVRLQAGLTLQDIATTAKVSRPTVEKAENGQTISYAYAVRIVNALNTLASASYTIEGLGIVTRK